MLWIVLPVGASAEVSIPNVVAVAAVYIRVTNEIIVVIDVDVVVAAPPSTPAPTAAPSRANCEPDSE
jgi:hypothetical protein